MSGPAPQPQTADQAVNAASTVADLRNKLQIAAINGAEDVPAAIKAIAALSPDFAPKALLASRSPAGTLVGTVVGWAVAKYGLACSAAAAASAGCWDATTVNVVTGVLVLAGTAIGAYVMRYITSKPIGSVLPKSST